MIDPELVPVKKEASPWATAFVVLIAILVGFTLIGPFIGLAIAYPFYGGKPMDFLNELADPTGNESMKALLYLVQACATFIGLAVIPFLFWKRMRHGTIRDVIGHNRQSAVIFLLVIGIVIFFMGPNSVFMEWNSNIDLPDGAFERWARATEDQAMELTTYMTSFTNAGQYLVGVIVIALLAGIGEELAFRGLLQPELQKATGNIHAGIWLSAIFFSALHLQFYGFVPRVMLGALFGYLYYYSGNLLVPMFAHFINNFFAVTVIYAGFEDITGTEGKNPTAPPWYAVLLFTVLCGYLLYEFKKRQPKSIVLNDVGA